MKKNILALALAGLIIGGVVSCKKDDDKTSSTTSSTSSTATTSTTSTTSTTGNPLTNKECTGTGSITVDNATDTMYTMEKVLTVGTLKSFGLYASGTKNSLTLFTGDTKLPAATKTFDINGDPDKAPAASQVNIEFYDGEAEEDYYATAGSVVYTITATEKTAKFTNVQFKSEDGTKTKTISFTVSLK
jgi:hypothetical protein